MLKIKGEELENFTDVGNHLIFGASGVGKTRFITSIPLYLLSKNIPSEEIKVFVLDFDKGIKKNLEPYPAEYTRFFDIYMVNNISDVKEAVEDIVTEVEEYVKKYNRKPFIAIDNINRWWEMSQDDFIQQAYNMNMAERTIIEVKSRINRRTDPGAQVVFKSITEDWQGIKALHKYYRDLIYNCGANILATSIAKEVKEETTNGRYEIVATIPGGEKEDRSGYPFDFISYLGVKMVDVDVKGTKTKAEKVMQYYMIVTKSRVSSGVKKFFDDNINFKNYMEWIERKIQKQRTKFMQNNEDIVSAVLSVMNTDGAHVEEDDTVLNELKERESILDDVDNDNSNVTDDSDEIDDI